MDKKTKGAWILSQSKSLDLVTGEGAARLENISYSGKIGRLYNLIRRNMPDAISPTINKDAVLRACQLNGIDRSTRETGLKILKDMGRIDVSGDGSVCVLGANSTAVLEVTAEIFASSSPTTDEEAVLELSNKVSERPVARIEAEEYIGDSFKIRKDSLSNLVDLCKLSAIIDEEKDRDKSILFNSNTFRDGSYARKTYLIIQGLPKSDAATLSEIQERLAKEGALHESTVEDVIGADLFRRLLSVGFFDRLEVSNSDESVGYITSPNDFQRFGRPFEEDPIDDAKALLASLTYGRTRSTYLRGSITMPDALLSALIDGREIGKNGVKAIGEDYHELEARQVVKVTKRSNDRYTMKLLKKDVGELALSIIRGTGAAQGALLLGGVAASGFRGPHDVRTSIRPKNTANDKKFVAEALDRLRSEG
ncbi:hypothetical protein [Azospirillum sp. TSH64]|uniref:hypothetical protein n=1 Tax=Azospirillum sp. TSH64 TaxID=652740 RepID=UPI0011B29F42|nr:hypothetical protein [Azospirillum sp. TSH64]